MAGANKCVFSIRYGVIMRVDKAISCSIKFTSTHFEGTSPCRSREGDELCKILQVLQGLEGLQIGSDQINTWLVFSKGWLWDKTSQNLGNGKGYN